MMSGKLRTYFWLLAGTACLVNNASSARILALVPLPSFSHQNAYRPLWKELSLRGHQVVLLTTDPMRNASLTNLTEVDWHGVYSIFADDHLVSDAFNLYESFKLFTYLDHIVSISISIMDYELQHPDVQKLLANKNESFDLVIGEFLIPEVIAFAFHFKCPFIGVDSMDAYYIPHTTMGNPTHPVLYPYSDVGFTEDLSFFGRMRSSVLNFFTRYYLMHYLSPVGSERVEKNFHLGSITQKQFCDKVCLLFINANPIFCNTRPLVPGTINLGEGIHLQEPKELPKVCLTWNLKYLFSKFSLG